MGILICGCGNRDQSKFTVDLGGDVGVRKTRNNPRPTVTLRGWKCGNCGHILPDINPLKPNEKAPA